MQKGRRGGSVLLTNIPALVQVKRRASDLLRVRPLVQRRALVVVSRFFSGESPFAKTFAHPNWDV